LSGQSTSASRLRILGRRAAVRTQLQGDAVGAPGRGAGADVQGERVDGRLHPGLPALCWLRAAWHGLLRARRGEHDGHAGHCVQEPRTQENAAGAQKLRTPRIGAEDPWGHDGQWQRC